MMHQEYFTLESQLELIYSLKLDCIFDICTTTRLVKILDNDDENTFIVVLSLVPCGTILQKWTCVMQADQTVYSRTIYDNTARELAQVVCNSACLSNDNNIKCYLCDKSIRDIEELGKP